MLSSSRGQLTTGALSALTGVLRAGRLLGGGCPRPWVGRAEAELVGPALRPQAAARLRRAGSQKPSVLSVLLHSAPRTLLSPELGVHVVAVASGSPPDGEG